MKVIQVELEDWQVEALNAGARRANLAPSEYVREVLARKAIARIDEACSSLLDPLWTAPIEYRLAHLLGR